MPSSLRSTKRSFKLALIVSVVATATTYAAQKAPSWPQFHGPNRDNLSSEVGLLKEWPEDGPELLWTAKGLGHGFSSIAVANRMIYTAGNIDDDTVITAMDMSGKTVWQAKIGAAWKGPHPGTRGTPTVDGNRLYYESPHGVVVCLDAKIGKKIWGRNILREFHGKNIHWALAESLLIDGDHVICCPGGPEVSVAALNKQTGKTVWKTPSTGDLAGYASPTLAVCQGLRVIITLTSRAIIGVNADTGELLWRVKHVSYADENVIMPIYDDGHVYVSTLAAGTVKWKINVEGKKASLVEVWRSKEMDNHHGGVILLDGYLYGSSGAFNRGKWLCIDAKTGKSTYIVKGVGKGSLTYADGLLYILSERGAVGLVRPTPTKHEVISSFHIPAGGEGPAWAHPVVCGGRLYIRHGQFLYAYNIAARE